MAVTDDAVSKHFINIKKQDDIFCKIILLKIIYLEKTQNRIYNSPLNSFTAKFFVFIKAITGQ